MATNFNQIVPQSEFDEFGNFVGFPGLDIPQPVDDPFDFVSGPDPNFTGIFQPSPLFSGTNPFAGVFTPPAQDNFVSEDQRFLAQQRPDLFEPGSPPDPTTVSTPELTAQQTIDAVSNISRSDVSNAARMAAAGPLGLMEAIATPFGVGQTARGFGNLGRGAAISALGGPLGLGIGIPTGLFGLAEVVQDLFPETFLEFGTLLGLVDPVQTQIADLFAEVASAFGGGGDFDAGVEAAGGEVGADIGGAIGGAGLGIGDFGFGDIDFGDFGFDGLDADQEGADAAGGADPSGGFGGGGGEADSEGEGEAESGGGDSDL